jgi:hypothetical protein
MTFTTVSPAGSERHEVVLQVLAVASVGVAEEPVMEALDLPAVHHLQLGQEDELLELDIPVDAVRRDGLEEEQ